MKQILIEHFGTFIGAILTGLAGFIFGRRKQNAETETIEAENTGKEIDNANKLVKYYLEPQKSASCLWRDELLPMGLKLFETAFKDILNGIIKRAPQDNKYSTFEPDTNVKDMYRPDLLMIEYKKSHS